MGGEWELSLVASEGLAEDECCLRDVVEERSCA